MAKRKQGGERKQRGREKKDWKRLLTKRDLCVAVGHDTCLQVDRVPAGSHSRQGWSKIKSLATPCPGEWRALTRLPILLMSSCIQKRSHVSISLCYTHIHTHSQTHTQVRTADFIPTLYEVVMRKTCDKPTCVFASTSVTTWRLNVVISCMQEIR